MCGIVGTLDLGHGGPPDRRLLRRMLSLIRHRGPDALGVYVDARAGLGSARLSIIDLDGGTQPIANEDETIWVIDNGEVFNYVELRAELLARGHRFRTRTDTEVIVHLYEERGAACVEALNGQFAIAIWDSRRRELLLARDRLGVRPLYYTVVAGSLLFGSEVKALFADDRVARRLDPRAIDQVFTCWTPLPGGSAFLGVQEIPAGHVLTARGGELRPRRYWSLDFPPASHLDGRSEVECVEAFRELLFDAARLQLRADVPVGVYLSGGLDSSAIAAIARQSSAGRLDAFSVAFEDAAYDEGGYQRQVARHLGVAHHTVLATGAEIARVFPEVVWHSETPLLRTAPAPLFLLAKLVRESGLKVVLTGEGADEFLGGYDIFKEDRVRRFWARDPASRLRPLLLRRLYPHVAGLAAQQQASLEAFFRGGLGATDRKGYSHLLRWANTSRLKRLFSPALRAALGGYDTLVELDGILDDRLLSWDPLSQAQYVEASILLTQYLLSSQGDRMAMAHSVEGRFPFLDHRLVEFCNALPPSLKLHRLEEKHALKRAVEDIVPPEVRRRVKQPYRAPIVEAFFGPGCPEYVAELLAAPTVARYGYFNPAAVGRLTAKARQTPRLGEMDAMALVGVLSVQLLHDLFGEGFAARAGAEPLADLTLCVDRAATDAGAVATGVTGANGGVR